MQTAKILIIEDDLSIGIGLKMNLEIENYEVKIAEKGLQGSTSSKSLRPT